MIDASLPILKLHLTIFKGGFSVKEYICEDVKVSDKQISLFDGIKNRKLRKPSGVDTLLEGILLDTPKCFHREIFINQMTKDDAIHEFLQSANIHFKNVIYESDKNLNTINEIFYDAKQTIGLLENGSS